MTNQQQNSPHMFQSLCSGAWTNGGNRAVSYLFYGENPHIISVYSFVFLCVAVKPEKA
jgi:hypothetical protein